MATKKEMYQLIAELNSENVEIVEFCNHEIELLNKKVKSTKPTKTQIENEKLKHVILEVLANADRPLTISEVMENEQLKGLTNQKVSGLMTRLKDAGMVVRTTEKRKAYFSLK